MPGSLPKGAWIPQRRELTAEEVGLLRFLTAENPDLSAQIDALKVVARCVCGCRTVAFGKTYQDEPIDGDWEIGFQGRADNGTLVGVNVLWELLCCS